MTLHRVLLAAPDMGRSKIAVIGPVYPFRTGIAYCTTRLAQELAREDDVTVISFSRQFPAFLYPGSSDRDPALSDRTPRSTRFSLDVVNPITWIREGLRLRRDGYDAVVLVWWIWVWALPYRILTAFLPSSVRIVAQCHNATDKEPSWWKSMLNRLLFRRTDAIVVHARVEADAIRKQIGTATAIHSSFLPVHEMGGAIPSREEARATLGVSGPCALFFGHVRPFKGLDIAIEALAMMKERVTLLVAGEVWWSDGEMYRAQVERLGLEDQVRFDFRFVPDDEIATWFAASDVVVVPYRHESQSGVALTALHFARPVIATRVGGLPEVIHDGVEGYLVPPENPAALALALDRFFADPAGRLCMEEGARQAAEKYSWTRYGSLFRTAIRSAVPRDGRDRADPG